MFQAIKSKLFPKRKKSDIYLVLGYNKDAARKIEKVAQNCKQAIELLEESRKLLPEIFEAIQKDGGEISDIRGDIDS